MIRLILIHFYGRDNKIRTFIVDLIFALYLLVRNARCLLCYNISEV